ncbi:hypothetical protein PFMALIP_05674, partial [Plasmodium falciparum MaliPS096_E11]
YDDDDDDEIDPNLQRLPLRFPVIEKRKAKSTILKNAKNETIVCIESSDSSSSTEDKSIRSKGDEYDEEDEDEDEEEEEEDDENEDDDDDDVEDEDDDEESGECDKEEETGKRKRRRNSRYYKSSNKYIKDNEMLDITSVGANDEYKYEDGDNLERKKRSSKKDKKKKKNKLKEKKNKRKRKRRKIVDENEIMDKIKNLNINHMDYEQQQHCIKKLVKKCIKKYKKLLKLIKKVILLSVENGNQVNEEENQSQVVLEHEQQEDVLSSGRGRRTRTGTRTSTRTSTRRDMDYKKMEGGRRGGGGKTTSDVTTTNSYEKDENMMNKSMTKILPPEIFEKIEEFIIFIGKYIDKFCSICKDMECREKLIQASWEYVSKFVIIIMDGTNNKSSTTNSKTNSNSSSSRTKGKVNNTVKMNNSEVLRDMYKQWKDKKQVKGSDENNNNDDDDNNNNNDNVIEDEKVFIEFFYAKKASFNKNVRDRNYINNDLYSNSNELVYSKKGNKSEEPLSKVRKNELLEENNLNINDSNESINGEVED